jgi:hypothetical protein
VGWPSPIPRTKNQIGGESQSRGLMAKPYRLALKYLDYKKDANPNAHVRVFNVVVRTNGKNPRST